MSRERTCSELEYMVMAMIASNVTSGYAMRKFVIGMRGGRWSTESGSIYRGLQRLIASGHVKETGKAGSLKRPRTEHELTDRGKQVLSEWMISPIEQNLLEILDDPVRSRAHFLELVPLRDRKGTVQSWIADSNRLIKEVDTQINGVKPTDRNNRKAMLQGYRNLVQARVDWLELIESNL